MPIINMVYKKKWKWKPWANTILYLPLESDVVDESGKGRTTSATSVTFTTVGGIQSAHVWTTWWISVWPSWFIDYSLTEGTISCLVNQSSISWNSVITEFAVSGKCKTSIWGSLSWAWKFLFGWEREFSAPTTHSTWTWYNVIVTFNKTTAIMYVNGISVATKSQTVTNAWGTWSSSWGQYVLCSRDWPNAWQSLNWNAREIIFEDKIWTAQEVANYYAQIKGKLWI